MYLYDRNMVAAANLKHANSSANYYVIMRYKNLKKKPQFFAFRSMKCRVEANNNRYAVVVCARVDRFTTCGMYTTTAKRLCTQTRHYFPSKEIILKFEDEFT